MQTGQFSDVNLASTLWEYKDSNAVQLTVFSAPGLKRVSFAEATRGEYKPTQIGASFGPTWSSHWFKLTVKLPSRVNGKRVLLLFDPECEGLVWSQDGQPLQGITGGSNGDRHVDFLLTDNAQQQVVHLYIEIAANGMFGAGFGGNGSIHPPVDDRYYRLATCEIAVANDEAHALWWDMEILIGMVKELPADSQAAADALVAANSVVNTVRPGDNSTIIAARRITTEFLGEIKHHQHWRHAITAVGHCHIDTAWLWPYDETKRKIARSWATQCSLIEQYPDYVFAASQAQQFEWLEQLYPSLFQRVKKHSELGGFVPIGGTWVEMDCNLPSGEAFCRQFLYGQRYFEATFGKRCSVFWLPDTFGYSAQLPQIIVQAGLKYFFTQKLSWNNINKFPNTTFYWKGLDGTSVLTHFCPADTYNAGATVRDVTFSVSNNKDKEYSNKSLLLYGNGDGGGGPLIPMIERLRRMQAVNGLPASVKFGDPSVFYEELEQTSHDLVTWKGELYFELHRGTYTSHALVKKYNRKSELLLRDVEVLCSLNVALGTDFLYPKKELDRVWKLLLLNQFHDVLPGSSIGLVYVDAIKYFEDVTNTCLKVKNDALLQLVKTLGTAGNSDNEQFVGVFNSTSWTRRSQIIEIDTTSYEKAIKKMKTVQTSSDGSKTLVLVKNVTPLSFGSVGISDDFTGVKVESKSGDAVVIQNGLVRVEFDKYGRLTSLLDLEVNRELVPPGSLGNVFKYFDDIPLFWDAWDVEVYHLEKSWDAGLGVVTIVERGPLRAALKIVQNLSDTSNLEQIVTVTADSKLISFDTTLNWNENRKILKVEFPWQINNDVATYETQYGYIQRPTHFNNSWDLARFEVCGHKFADLSEYGYGVSLLNDCKYGYSTFANVMRLSLLRAPKSPDDKCDIGKHSFKYAVYPHTGSFDASNVVQAGYEFNVPLTVFAAPKMSGASFLSIDQPNVVIDTVKLVEDMGPGKQIVVRLYEAQGGRGKARLSSRIEIKKAEFVNILEESKGEAKFDGHSVEFEFKPFQLISLSLSF